jgi:hypothetical protein
VHASSERMFYLCEWYVLCVLFWQSRSSVLFLELSFLWFFRLVNTCPACGSHIPNLCKWRYICWRSNSMSFPWISCYICLWNVLFLKCINIAMLKLLFYSVCGCSPEFFFLLSA